MTMIALGGVIGAGLFVGSGVVIKSAGPAAVLSFSITGLLVVLVMRMLGEMAVALPAVGSFYEYARLAWRDQPRVGELAGFLTGWMYWYFWVIVVALEAVAGAGLVRFWLPDQPAWLISLALLVTLTLTNLISVRSYGEFEFWFASIKVAAIVVFLMLAGVYVLGLWPGVAPSVANLTAHGGFAPNGLLPIVTGAVAATGFYFGAEIVTIAAAEAAEPAKAVARGDELGHCARPVLLRRVDPAGRVPRALEFAGNHRALRQRPQGDGHSRSGADHERGGPHGGAVGAEFGAVCIVANAIRADTPRRCSARSCQTQPQRRAVPCDPAGNSFRLWRGGHVLCLAGHGFCFSGQFVRNGGDFRLRADCDFAAAPARTIGTGGSGATAVRMWAYPYLTYVAIAGMLSIVLAMAFIPEQRTPLLFGVISLGLLLLGFSARVRFGGKPDIATLAMERHRYEEL